MIFFDLNSKLMISLKNGLRFAPLLFQHENKNTF